MKDTCQQRLAAQAFSGRAEPLDPRLAGGLKWGLKSGFEPPLTPRFEYPFGPRFNHRLKPSLGHRRGPWLTGGLKWRLKP
ncbi:MAG TPA: hypothetical protein VGC09_12880 [Rhodopila sp.]